MPLSFRRLASAAAMVFMLPATAFAHAHLTSATPPIDSSLSGAPTQLRLVFSEAVALRFTGLTLAGPDQAAVPTGQAAPGSGDREIVVPLQKPLSPGRYTVEWHALASDGHKTSGHYTFTVRP